jgi:ankyrin repeat protein
MEQHLIPEFYKACSYGNLELVESYIKSTDIDQRTMNIALLEAAYGGHLPTVKYLVSCGSEIAYDRYLALRSAASQGCLDVVVWFVEQGANVNRRSSCSPFSETLKCALENRHFNDAHFLMSKGADDSKDIIANFFLYYLKYYGNGN